METELLIDALYLHAARQACARASNAVNGIRLANARWKFLVQQERKVLAKYSGDAQAPYDELESICIQMESADYQIGEAHAPIIKESAAVHFLSCAALESHINSVAKSELSGEYYASFDRLSLETKWLYLPKLRRWKGFEPDRAPFEDFVMSIRFRNRLVHYKPRKERWVQGRVPAFLEGLGLTVRHAEASVLAAEAMIDALAKMRGKKSPYWLRRDLNEMDYLKMSIE
jgi:hypothetical protein